MATKKRKKTTVRDSSLGEIVTDHGHWLCQLNQRIEDHLDWLAELTSDIRLLKDAAKSKPEPPNAPRFRVSSYPNAGLHWVEEIGSLTTVVNCYSAKTAESICNLLNKHGLQ